MNSSLLPQKCPAYLSVVVYEMGGKWLTDGPISIGQPTRTCIRQLCADIEYNLEVLSRVMAYREVWREKIKGIPVISQI